MKKYKAIIFDLFGTVVHFDETRLPFFKYQDEEIYCTTPPLYEIATNSRNGYSIHYFHETLREIILGVRREKSDTLKEISCLTRMKLLLNRLQFPENEETDALARQMKESHMGWMKKCVFMPEGYLSFFEKLGSRRIGLLSNFDDSSTGYEILEEMRIKHYFHSILFSEEAGLIKPNRDLFIQILNQLEALPPEVLFVGDTPAADIVGPKEAGMDTAWINPEGYSFPENNQRPDFELKNITELEPIINFQY